MRADRPRAGCGSMRGPPSYGQSAGFAFHPEMPGFAHRPAQPIEPSREHVDEEHEQERQQRRIEDDPDRFWPSANSGDQRDRQSDDHPQAEEPPCGRRRALGPQNEQPLHATARVPVAHAGLPRPRHLLWYGLPDWISRCRAVLPGTAIWVAGSYSLPTAALPCGTQISTTVLV